MGQASAADQAMGRVFVVQRRQDVALLQQLRVIRAGLGAAQGDLFLQAALGADRRECQCTGAAGVAHYLDLGTFDETDLALPGSVFILNQAHVRPSRKSWMCGEAIPSPQGHSMMLKSPRYSSEISRPRPGLLSSSWM
ncbi:hypothetical protein D3C87_1528220 [compost metagenome]